MKILLIGILSGSAVFAPTLSSARPVLSRAPASSEFDGVLIPVRSEYGQQRGAFSFVRKNDQTEIAYQYQSPMKQRFSDITQFALPQNQHRAQSVESLKKLGFSMFSAERALPAGNEAVFFINGDGLHAHVLDGSSIARDCRIDPRLLNNNGGEIKNVRYIMMTQPNGDPLDIISILGVDAQGSRVEGTWFFNRDSVGTLLSDHFAEAIGLFGSSIPGHLDVRIKALGGDSKAHDIEAGLDAESRKTLQDVYRNTNAMKRQRTTEMGKSNATAAFSAPISRDHALTVVPTGNGAGSSENSARVATPRDLKGHQEYLARFRKIMNEHLKGQPEAVDHFVEIEAAIARDGGYSKAPEVGALFGLPGTGKDTAIEAAVLAKHEAKGETNVDIEKHIFRYRPVKEHDVWSVTGSGSGYKGSSRVSALNRFLVLHSGGKYQILPKDPKPNDEEYIVLNPKWKEGDVLKGYYAPSDAILYVNEFHDWAREAKQILLKEAFEKGFYVVGAPGQGVDRIQVPVQIEIAGNYGISLIAARDSEGNRVGAPLSEEELLARHAIGSKQEELLDKELAAPSPANPDGGTSEEVRSRIPKSRRILLRPQTRDVRAVIATKMLETLSKKDESPKRNGFPHFKLAWDQALVDFLITYDQLAEDGSRSLKAKVKSMVETPISKALVDGTLQIASGDTLHLSIKKNEDGTHDLLINTKSFLLEPTLKARNALPMTDARIDELSLLEPKINDRVKGIKHIAKQIARDIRLAENEEKATHIDLQKKRADVYALFGSSSTGKTELAVAVHQILTKSNSKPLLIDFGQIKSIQDLRDKVLGSRDRMNKPIASDFMKYYDRSNGEMVFVLDEFTNAPMEVQMAFYDLIREPVVRTFSDGEPRAMGKVKIFITGNVGEEWYKDIPRDIPEHEQLEAARNIYEQSIGNEGFLRGFLTKRFTEAFLNRVGLNRIYFFGPHTSETTRELIQSKLVSAMRSLSTPRPGVRYWDLKFRTQRDYVDTITAIEDYGFKIWEQGASIVNFIDMKLMRDIQDELILAKIPIGAKIEISKVPDEPGKQESHVRLELHVAGQATPILVKVKGKAKPVSVPTPPEHLFLVALHEAGHEIVNHVLLSQKTKSGGVRIRPGVTPIDDRWVRYLGLASHEEIEKSMISEPMVIARIAILAAGAEAEKLVTFGQTATAGRQNDIGRQTDFARNAILSWGLSEKWGVSSFRPGQGESLEQYIASLSNARKELLENEVERYLKLGQELARDILVSNFDSLLIPIGTKLVGTGDISGDQLEEFYRENASKIIDPDDTGKVEEKKKEYAARVSAEKPSRTVREFKFLSFVKLPKKIFDVQKDLDDSRNEALAKVDLSAGNAIIASARIGLCREIFPNLK